MLLALIATSVLAWRATAKTCSPLKNRDIFSTVEVKVGTPPQRFELVADTGSNTLIVQSCICQDLGSCPSTFGRCFRGNSTSTFSIARDGTSNDSATHPQVWILKYGSGDIEALVSSDVVSLGSYSVRMNSSLLLMVSQALKFDSSFEGILGLGVPNLTVNTGPHGGTHRPQMLRSFLEEAQVERFSLCFNSGADGVLALDYAAPVKLLPSVFHEHWQLRLRGASVAGHALSMAQDSPAYAIPDSGTTLVTGPQEKITSLMEFICEEWPRCKHAKQDLTLSMAQVKTFSNMSFSGTTRQSRKDRLLTAHAKWHGGEMSQSGASFTASGAHALQMLLEDCNNWKKGIDLNAEMPSIKLQLEGADGTQQEVELLPSSYVAEVTSNAMVWTQKYLLGILPYWWPELEEDSSCATLLGAADYVGHQVWILGTPLFYNRRVHFDLGQPPKMGFSEEPCGSCASGDYHTGDLALIQGVNANVAMRQLSSPGRVPWPKVSEPLGPLDVPI